MKAVVITESGGDMGFGHLMRCRSICAELEKAGVKAHFIVNKYPALNNNFDLAIVDSYRLNRAAYLKIWQKTGLLVCIDDNKRLDYPDGIVINGAVYAKDLDYHKCAGVNYLLGPRYSPLRSEFSACGIRSIKKDIRNVLITFGGSDFRTMSLKTVNFFLSEFPDLKINVLVGSNLNARGMIGLMRSSDVAISAGGQTLYELACTGTPTVGVCVADNQLNNLRGWVKLGFLKFCGWYNDKNLFDNLKKAMACIEDVNIRKKMSRVGQMFVDGKGSKRISGEILRACK